MLWAWLRQLQESRFSCASFRSLGSVVPFRSGDGAVALGAATAVPAGASGPPAFAAVPGVSGRQQRQETSRPSRRCRRSSSNGTDRRSKKRPRGRSPSPGPSSRRREWPYRSDSESSEDARAEASPPRAERAPGGTPGDFCPVSAGDRSPSPGPSGWTSRSSTRAEHYRSVAGRRSPLPSGGADDDRSSAFDTVDFDRDDFPVSLGPHPELPHHGRACRNPISSVQDFSCIDLWVNVGDFSGISPACLSLGTVASGRH